MPESQSPAAADPHDPAVLDARPDETREEASPDPVRDGAVHEEHLGDRDLTRFRTPPGRWLAERVARADRWEQAHLILVATLAVGAGLVLTFTAGAAEIYDAVEDGDGIARFDRPVLDAAKRLRSPGLDSAVTHFSDIGGPVVFPVVAAVAAIALALIWRRVAPVVLTTLAAAGSLAMTIIGKDVVGRVRPPLAEAVPPYEHSPSFPSGHTLNTTVIVGVLVYLVLTRLRTRRARIVTAVLGVLWILAMGASRVFLGHHWLTDVAMGWTLGAAWVAVLVLAHRLFLTRRRAVRESAPAVGRPGGRPPRAP